ncbi:purine-nucleoside phosphorylase [Anaerobranca gottschalkii]|uniref:Purine nucleoside phosphorylase n=1 Tax=Anaerobranca gottschalkii DSM 13577 TaxID=1120990 RepID=A0A1H9Y1D7_9FIRM|nr:purine-nucleoside phosphorylase [Anaerobranca gottschalkii]SES62444.1 purine-nucleoside phosphorylase [Anaerobranca gottschalkii DSM 13577]
MSLLQKIKEAAEVIKSKVDILPEIGLILGSGLGTLADEIEESVAVPYEEIPHFPKSTVSGHAGRLVIGKLEGKRVVAMQGRFHYYEGYSLQEVTFPVYVMHALGIKALVVTNACGGLNKKFAPGDLMLITDHINTYFTNPLIGPNYEELGPRFPDMSQAYNREFIAIAERVADELNIKVQKGVYAPVTGPSYCTPAELRMLITLGGDTVGMSTVPEVIVANYLGIKVLGISCITDMAIPDHLEPLTHEQVVKIANQTRPKFIKLVKGWLKEVTV